MIADFRPEAQRTNVAIDDLGNQREDNPREVFDNRPSNIPWDESGRFNRPEDMAKLLNSSKLRDPLPIRATGVLLALITFGGYAFRKRQAIKEGTFREVKKGLHTEVRLPGYYTLWSPKSHWGEEHPLDDEEHDVVQVGKGTSAHIKATRQSFVYVRIISQLPTL